jgi:hypothetical protein
VTAALRPAVLAALRGHGLEPASSDTPEALRERLNDLYLEEVRRLKERQKAGEIPLREYGAHVSALKERYLLLGLPLADWIAVAARTTKR